VLHPDIPWQLIAGMRDKLIHNYDDIDWEEVWKTSTTDIPVLLAQLELEIRLKRSKKWSGIEN
jgi:uncharacterized protein with HEPN domain